MTREEPRGETKSVQEAADEGETKVYEVVGKVISGRKYYIISFWIEVFISYEDMK